MLLLCDLAAAAAAFSSVVSACLYADVRVICACCIMSARLGAVQRGVGVTCIDLQGVWEVGLLVLSAAAYDFDGLHMLPVTPERMVSGAQNQAACTASKRDCFRSAWFGMRGCCVWIAPVCACVCQVCLVFHHGPHAIQMCGSHSPHSHVRMQHLVQSDRLLQQVVCCADLWHCVL